MKILIATDTYPPQVNGAAQFTYRIAHILAKRSHVVQVLAPSRTWGTEEYTTGGVTVVGIPSIPLYVNNMRVAAPFLAPKYLERKILAFQPDVLHVQGHFGLSQATVRIAQKNHIPIVGTNHFMPDNLTHYLHLPRRLEAKVDNMVWQQCYAFFEKLNVVTTPTNKAAELFTHRGFTKPVHVISNGIDTKRFQPLECDQAIKQKYCIPSTPIALTVGRLDKEKNIDVIIRALKLARKQTDIHFVIAGSDKGSEARHLRRLVEQLNLQGAVTFTGFVPDEDLPGLYRCADVFIMAGTAELQSIATMEAMASGLPIIAADAVALPELVIPEKTGYLFKPNNVQNLSDALISLFSNPQQQKEFGKNSRVHIEQHDLNAVAAIFETYYHDPAAH